jgi:uncharacterized membrane protein
MRWSALIPAVLLGLGVALVVDAVLHGAAAVAVVVIVPVVFGSSATFLLGVVLLLAGFLTLPLAFEVREEPRPATVPGPPRPHSEVPPAEVGGLLLIGPVPIFLGNWKTVSRRIKFTVGVLGAAVVVALFLFVYWH